MPMLISFFLAKAKTMNTKIIIPKLNHKGFLRGLSVPGLLKILNIINRFTHKPNATAKVIIHRRVINLQIFPLVFLWFLERDSQGIFCFICTWWEIKIIVPKNPKSSVPRLNRIGD